MHLRIAIAALCLTGTASVAAAQGPPAAGADGAAVFTRACASCHQPGQTAVPPPETLRTLAPEAIVTALTTGKMAEQGKTLSAAEHRAVAQFLTGRAPAVATGPAATPTVTMCKAATPTADAAPVDGEDLGEMLVNAGLARVWTKDYQGQTKMYWCENQSGS